MVIAVGLLTAVAVWVVAARLPFFSETYTLLEQAGRQASPLDALDPRLAPFRPFQHLYFWCLSHFEVDSPAAARLPAFVLHVLNAVAVCRLARQFGLMGRSHALCVLLFVAFPSANGLIWVGAIGTPAHACFALWAIVAAIAHAERPRRRTGIGMLGGLAGAMACHEMAAMTPIAVFVCVLGASATRGETLSVALAKVTRDNWFRAVLTVWLTYAIYLFLLRPERSHSIAPLGAVAANAVRAALALGPEVLRHWAVDVLRVGDDTGSVIAAVLLCVGLPAGILTLAAGGGGRGSGPRRLRTRVPRAAGPLRWVRPAVCVLLLGAHRDRLGFGPAAP